MADAGRVARVIPTYPFALIGRGINLNAAESFGDLAAPLLTVAQAQSWSPEVWCREIMAYYVRIKLTEQDYLIPLGHPIVMAIAIAVASEYLRAPVNVLVWDNYAVEYRPMRMPVIHNLRKESAE